MEKAHLVSVSVSAKMVAPDLQLVHRPAIFGSLQFVEDNFYQLVGCGNQFLWPAAKMKKVLSVVRTFKVHIGRYLD